MTGSPALDPGDVAAVCSYMNAQQADAVRYIARRLGGASQGAMATMVDMTTSQVVIETHGPSGDVGTVRIPWPAAVASRDDLRTQLHALLDRAATR
ncbi:MAG: hypothetical protein RL499_1221 [Actinomycetota bacterium]|jgi:hypothetical protein